MPPAAAAVRDYDVRFKKVLHIVRCPTGNVAALSTHRRETLAFAARALALPPPPTEDAGPLSSQFDRSLFRLPPRPAGAARKRRDRWLAFLADLWLGWNARVERYADARTRIEDDLSGAALCDLVELGIDGDGAERICSSSADSTTGALDSAKTLTRMWSHWVVSRGDFSPQRCLRGACADGPKTPHHRKHANVSWADLSAALGGRKLERVAAAARRYGYGADGGCGGGAGAPRATGDVFGRRRG